MAASASAVPATGPVGRAETPAAAPLEVLGCEADGGDSPGDALRINVRAGGQRCGGETVLPHRLDLGECICMTY